MCCYAPTGSKEMRDGAHPPIVLWLSKYRLSIPSVIMAGGIFYTHF
nr:MAG TPA: hypothetical protein [Caudoviricetes sp.]